jgi:amino acid transporter
MLALVNARGTVLGGGLQVFVTAIKVATLVGIALLPVAVVGLGGLSAFAVSFNNLAPVWPEDWLAVDWSKFGAALVGVLWAYHGWMNIAPVAEDLKQPSRNIPLSLLVGTLVVMILYVSANFAYYLVVSGAEMRTLPGDRIVAAEFALRLLGPIGLLLASAAIMTSVFGALNGNMLAGPRLLFAMGRDGLAPGALGELHPRWRTPALAVYVLAGWAVFLVVGGSLLVQYPGALPTLEFGDFKIDLNLPPDKKLFDLLTDYAMFGAVSFETMAVAALLVLRPRSDRANTPAPYRCPLFPWLPLIYVLAMGAVLVNMFWTKSVESIIAVGFILVGGLVYGLLFGGRKRIVY